jgi:hypothetical protein
MNAVGKGCSCGEGGDGGRFAPCVCVSYGRWFTRFNKLTAMTGGTSRPPASSISAPRLRSVQTSSARADGSRRDVGCARLWAAPPAPPPVPEFAPALPHALAPGPPPARDLPTRGRP